MIPASSSMDGNVGHAYKGKRHRYSDGYTLQREWDLDGLTDEQKDNVLPGLRPYFWTPIPIGMIMTSYMVELLSFIKDLSTETVRKQCLVLNGTAGAGGTTMALGHCFDNVTAGDFCPAQLKCLRHNIDHVMLLSNRVKVDAEPTNVLHRKDMGRYSAMLLEPCWGGLQYRDAADGSLDLYLQTGEYEEHLYEKTSEVHGDDAAGNVNLFRFRPVQEVVLEIMENNPSMDVLMVLLPWNFNVLKFQNDIIQGHGHQYDILLLDPHKIHPANIDASMFGALREQLTPKFMDEVQRTHAYAKYGGPDAFVAIVRREAFLLALHREVNSCNLQDIVNKAKEFGERKYVLWKSSIAHHFKRRWVDLKAFAREKELAEVTDKRSSAVRTGLHIQQAGAGDIINTSCEYLYWEKAMARQEGWDHDDTMGAHNKDIRDKEVELSSLEYDAWEANAFGGEGEDFAKLNREIKKKRKELQDAIAARSNALEMLHDSGGGGSSASAIKKKANAVGVSVAIIRDVRYDNRRKDGKEWQLFSPGATKPYGRRQFIPVNYADTIYYEDISKPGYVNDLPWDPLKQKDADARRIIVDALTGKTYRFKGWYAVDHRRFRYYAGCARPDMSDINVFVYDINNNMVAARMYNEMHFIWRDPRYRPFAAAEDSQMHITGNLAKQIGEDNCIGMDKFPPVKYYLMVEGGADSGHYSFVKDAISKAGVPYATEFYNMDSKSRNVYFLAIPKAQASSYDFVEYVCKPDGTLIARRKPEHVCFEAIVSSAVSDASHANGLNPWSVPNIEVNRKEFKPLRMLDLLAAALEHASHTSGGGRPSYGPEKQEHKGIVYCKANYLGLKGDKRVKDRYGQEYFLNGMFAMDAARNMYLLGDALAFGVGLGEFVYNRQGGLLAERVGKDKGFTDMCLLPAAIRQESGESAAQEAYSEVTSSAWNDPFVFSGRSGVRYIASPPGSRVNLFKDVHILYDMQYASLMIGWGGDYGRESFTWDSPRYIARDICVPPRYFFVFRGSKGSVAEVAFDANGKLLGLLLDDVPLESNKFASVNYELDSFLQMDMGVWMSSNVFKMFPMKATLPYLDKDDQEQVKIGDIAYYRFPTEDDYTASKMQQAQIYCPAYRCLLYRFRDAQVWDRHGITYRVEGLCAEDVTGRIYVTAIGLVNGLRAEFVYDREGGLLAERLHDELVFTSRCFAPGMHLLNNKEEDHLEVRDMPYFYFSLIEPIAEKFNFNSKEPRAKKFNFNSKEPRAQKFNFNSKESRVKNLDRVAVLMKASKVIPWSEEGWKEYKVGRIPIETLPPAVWYETVVSMMNKDDRCIAYVLTSQDAFGRKKDADDKLEIAIDLRLQRIVGFRHNGSTFSTINYDPSVLMDEYLNLTNARKVEKEVLPPQGEESSSEDDEGEDDEEEDFIPVANKRKKKKAEQGEQKKQVTAAKKAAQEYHKRFVETMKPASGSDGGSSAAGAAAGVNAWNKGSTQIMAARRDYDDGDDACIFSVWDSVHQKQNGLTNGSAPTYLPNARIMILYKHDPDSGMVAKFNGIVYYPFPTDVEYDTNYMLKHNLAYILFAKKITGKINKASVYDAFGRRLHLDGHFTQDFDKVTYLTAKSGAAGLIEFAYDRHGGLVAQRMVDQKQFTILRTKIPFAQMDADEASKLLPTSNARAKLLERMNSMQKTIVRTWSNIGLSAYECREPGRFGVWKDGRVALVCWRLSLMQGRENQRGRQISRGNQEDVMDAAFDVLSGRLFAFRFPNVGEEFSFVNYVPAKVPIQGDRLLLNMNEWTEGGWGEGNLMLPGGIKGTAADKWSGTHGKDREASLENEVKSQDALSVLDKKQWAGLPIASIANAMDSSFFSEKVPEGRRIHQVIKGVIYYKTLDGTAEDAWFGRKVIGSDGEIWTLSNLVAYTERGDNDLCFHAYRLTQGVDQLETEMLFDNHGMLWAERVHGDKMFRLVKVMMPPAAATSGVSSIPRRRRGAYPDVAKQVTIGNMVYSLAPRGAKGFPSSIPGIAEAGVLQASFGGALFQADASSPYVSVDADGRTILLLWQKQLEGPVSRLSAVAPFRMEVVLDPSCKMVVAARFSVPVGTPPLHFRLVNYDMPLEVSSGPYLRQAMGIKQGGIISTVCCRCMLPIHPLQVSGNANNPDKFDRHNASKEVAEHELRRAGHKVLEAQSPDDSDDEKPWGRRKDKKTKSGKVMPDDDEYIMPDEHSHHKFKNEHKKTLADYRKQPK